ncbi:MAG: hypothetical protein WDA24_04020 [Tissierellales bacterium]
MKKISLIFAFVLFFALSILQVAYANMAAPREADIFVTYKMKNTSDESISTQSMFLSPNILNSGVKVVVNDKDTSFTVENYALNYDTEIKTNDWKYVVLTDDEIASRNEEQTVDTITFEMDFTPNEEYDVMVS